MTCAPPAYDDVTHNPPPPKYDDPPQPGWNPPQGEPVSVVPVAVPTIPTAGVMIPGPSVGPQPQGMFCPSCHDHIVTDIVYTNSSKTHLAALALCFLGGIFCFWIPYVMDSCRNIHHYCPNCGAYIGAYK